MSEGDARHEPAIGRAKGEAEEPMELWELVDDAVWDLADDDGDDPDRYPTDVEVEIRVE